MCLFALIMPIAKADRLIEKKIFSSSNTSTNSTLFFSLLLLREHWGKSLQTSQWVCHRRYCMPSNWPLICKSNFHINVQSLVITYFHIELVKMKEKLEYVTNPLDVWHNQTTIKWQKRRKIEIWNRMQWQKKKKKKNADFINHLMRWNHNGCYAFHFQPNAIDL